MAAVTGLGRLGGARLAASPAGRGRPVPWWSRRWWRLGVLAVVGAYFLVPLYAALRFSLSTTSGGWSVSAWTTLPGAEGFGSAFFLSLRLALLATVLAVGLVVPAGLLVHLRLPRLRALMDVCTTLPIVIPPIVLVLGLLSAAPSWLKATPYLLSLEYAVLGFPFVYRSLDAGLRAIDHATLTDAARSLGAGWRTTFTRVLLPNLRAAILSGTVLCVALAFGEFTMASLDQYQTFPVWIVNFDQSNSPQTSVAASLAALGVTWALLLTISLLGGRRRRAVVTDDDEGGHLR